MRGTQSVVGEVKILISALRPVCNKPTPPPRPHHQVFERQEYQYENLFANYCDGI